jgi:hypothetical protein
MPVTYHYVRFTRHRWVERSDLLEAAREAVQHSRDEFCAFVSLSDGATTFSDLRQVEGYIEAEEARLAQVALQYLFIQALAEADLERKNIFIRQIAKQVHIPLTPAI